MANWICEYLCSKLEVWLQY